MKRNVMISGEFTINELTTTGKTAAKPTQGKKTAAARIAALKAAGVDTSCYFPMGEEMVIKVVDGVPEQVMDDDPIFSKIAEGGYINHYKLFRRWVMSQMFRTLRYMEKSGRNFNETLQFSGYEYQWRMLENELYAQMKMEKHGDNVSLLQRKRWFNGETAYRMASDYLHNLSSYIETELKYRINSRGEKVFKHKCKGVPYVRLAGKNIFVADLKAKVYSPLAVLSVKMCRAKSVKELYNLVFKFNRERKRLAWETKMSNTFINAFKGSGAYFTMRNLIMFHGARFKGMNETKSLLYVETKAKEYKDEGWRMMGVMKQLIADSGISVEAKIAEWKK